MLLNVWQSIRDFFGNLFESVSFGSIITLLTGVVIGVLICLIVYIITILKSVKTKENTFNEKNITKNELGISNEEEVELIKKYIETSKNQFLEESEDLKTSEKINVLKDVCLNMVVDIAKIYYPNSEHPLFELSVDELIKLDYYIVGRIEKILDKRIIRNLTKLRISTVMSIYDKKKKMDNNKIVKAAKKLNVGGVSSVIMGALNIINPAYWSKKVGIKLPLDIALNKICCSAIGIVGDETAKIYSKNAFNNFDSSDEELLLEEDEIIEKE